MIVLDTHVLIWLDTGDQRLGQMTRQLIDASWAADQAAVSAITFWESALLAAHGRIQLTDPPETWRAELLDAGLGELPIDGAIAILAVDLQDLHKDPADRLIVATAIRAGATLLTADARLLAWGGNLARHDAET